MAKPHYISCKATGGKHKFERLTHNQFEKCMECGEPRFALIDHSYRPETGGWVRGDSQSDAGAKS